MNRYLLCGLLAAAACLPSNPLFAGPLQRADVASEPSWVLHLDCDVLRSSSLGKFIAQELEKPEAKNKLDAFQAMFNFDPRTALHGISLYGLDNNPDGGLLIAYADFDAARLQNLVKGAKEYQSSTHRSRTIHSWIDEHKKSPDGASRRMYGAVAGNRVIFAQQQSRLTGALDVIDGFSPNLSGTKAFSSMGQASSGKILQGAVRKITVPEGNPNAALVKLSEEIRCEVVETDGNMIANMNLLAKDPEVAGHMNSIAQGLLSLVKMQTDKPERVKLAERLVLKQDGSALNGTLTIPTAEILTHLKAQAAKKAAGN
jgi:hypothetical protein